jgi:hypothetical protein
MSFPLILTFAFVSIALLQAPTYAFQSNSISNNIKLMRKSALQASSAPLYTHHTCIRTRNIENAINFYSLFGYGIEVKFRAGPARAVWLTNSKESKTGQSDAASRLEIIEVPNYVLDEKEGTIKRALDLMKHETLLGLNHFALDVTPHILSLEKKEYYGLDQFLKDVNEKSKAQFGKDLNVALNPRQVVIGSQVFELCFLYDADGCIFELLRFIKDLDQNVQSGWEPWDGSGFVGGEDDENSRS